MYVMHNPVRFIDLDGLAAGCSTKRKLDTGGSGGGGKGLGGGTRIPSGAGVPTSPTRIVMPQPIPKTQTPAQQAVRQTQPASSTVSSGNNITFGSSTKSSQSLANQMAKRGWTEESVRHAANNAYTTRSAVNKATGNDATAFFNRDGSHVVIDNVTREVIQVSNKHDPNWIPDISIINPFRPGR